MHASPGRHGSPGWVSTLLVHRNLRCPISLASSSSATSLSASMHSGRSRRLDAVSTDCALQVNQSILRPGTGSAEDLEYIDLMQEGWNRQLYRPQLFERRPLTNYDVERLIAKHESGTMLSVGEQQQLNALAPITPVMAGFRPAPSMPVLLNRPTSAPSLPVPLASAPTGPPAMAHKLKAELKLARGRCHSLEQLHEDERKRRLEITQRLKATLTELAEAREQLADSEAVVRIQQEEVAAARAARTADGTKLSFVARLHLKAGRSQRRPAAEVGRAAGGEADELRSRCEALKVELNFERQKREEQERSSATDQEIVQLQKARTDAEKEQEALRQQLAAAHVASARMLRRSEQEHEAWSIERRRLLKASEASSARVVVLTESLAPLQAQVAAAKHELRRRGEEHERLLKELKWMQAEAASHAASSAVGSAQPPETNQCASHLEAVNSVMSSIGMSIGGSLGQSAASLGSFMSLPLGMGAKAAGSAGSSGGGDGEAEVGGESEGVGGGEGEGKRREGDSNVGGARGTGEARRENEKDPFPASLYEANELVKVGPIAWVTYSVTEDGKGGEGGEASGNVKRDETAEAAFAIDLDSLGRDTMSEALQGWSLASFLASSSNTLDHSDDQTDHGVDLAGTVSFALTRDLRRSLQASGLPLTGELEKAYATQLGVSGSKEAVATLLRDPAWTTMLASSIFESMQQLQPRGRSEVETMQQAAAPAADSAATVGASKAKMLRCKLNDKFIEKPPESLPAVEAELIIRGTLDTFHERPFLRDLSAQLGIQPAAAALVAKPVSIAASSTDVCAPLADDSGEAASAATTDTAAASAPMQLRSGSSELDAASVALAVKLSIVCPTDAKAKQTAAALERLLGSAPEKPARLLGWAGALCGWELVSPWSVATVHPLPELTLGPLSDFFGGLQQVIGLPSTKRAEGMEAEHTKSADSAASFTTGNYGVKTSSLIEYYFVVDPSGKEAELGPWPSEARLLEDASLCRKPCALATFAKQRRKIDAQLHRTQTTALADTEFVGLRLYTGPMFECAVAKLELVRRVSPAARAATPSARAATPSARAATPSARPATPSHRPPLPPRMPCIAAAASTTPCYAACRSPPFPHVSRRFAKATSILTRSTRSTRACSSSARRPAPTRSTVAWPGCACPTTLSPRTSMGSLAASSVVS